jgi:hypothetical protein
MNKITTDAVAASLLSALGEQLEQLEASYDLVVVGGSALVALGLIARATRDVDIVAIHAGGRLDRLDDLPAPLAAARDRVARDFQLPPDWLNAEASSLLDFGLPEGFLSRTKRRSYGPALSVWYASRLDQIHFKLYAAVDQGPGKHEADLRALRPTEEELLAAARWSRGHDPSPAYATVLRQALAAFGVSDEALGA